LSILCHMKNVITIVLKLMRKFAMNYIFVVSAFGTAVSLYFSEFMDLPPCDLCWYQRIFFYPIFVIALVALGLKDRGLKVYYYILTLSIIGLPIAVYHHLLKVTDLFPKQTPFCGTSGACSKIDWELIQGSGLTIPLLAALGFLMIIVLCVVKVVGSEK